MKNEEKSQVNIGSDLRPPIVTVLGHVDHGKTTLLDRIRNTSIAAREAGGITQSIGASVVKLANGFEITFIDTPGHAAFSSMRGRGVRVADIAILVVSCDDGVKPQTREALAYIIESKTPYVVAATKMDLASADIELVKSSCEKEGIVIEGKGGDIPVVPVSGKTGEGVKELLEIIQLMWEMKSEKFNENDPLEGYIFEVGKDRRGNFASMVIKNGTLMAGDEIFTEDMTCKVRGIFDYLGQQVKEVKPGYPCQIIGFDHSPSVGVKVSKKDQGEFQAEASSKKRIIPKVEDDQIGILVKAKNAGSLEALISNLPDKVVVIDSSVGDVIESDIFLAKSTKSDIFVFEANIPSQIIKLAETEDIKIYKFDIIYELFLKLDEILKKGRVEEVGKTQIISQFPFNNKKVAGCKVLQGRINKSDKLILKRQEKILGNIKIISMKKGKVDIEGAKQGEELGLIFVPQLEFLPGDVILSVK